MVIFLQSPGHIFVIRSKTQLFFLISKYHNDLKLLALAASVDPDQTLQTM